MMITRAVPQVTNAPEKGFFKHAGIKKRKE
jgi:hypothetical protein